MILSYELGTSAGGTIVLVSAVLFFLSWLWGAGPRPGRAVIFTCKSRVSLYNKGKETHGLFFMGLRKETEKMSEPLITGMHHVALEACGEESLERAIAFYTEKLGMTLVRTWGEGTDGPPW